MFSFRLPDDDDVDEDDLYSLKLDFFDSSKDELRCVSSLVFNFEELSKTERELLIIGIFVVSSYDPELFDVLYTFFFEESKLCLL